MRLSLFAHARDNQPQLWETDWGAFTEDFGPHTFVDVDVDRMSKDDLDHFKEGLKAFSPAEYPEGVARGRSNVLRVHLLVLDVDDRDEEELAAFIEKAEGLAMVVCSTFSRGIKKGARARIVMPLTRPVERSEWDRFWTLANGLFDGIGDPQCKDPNRIYFGCYAPKSKAEEHFYEVLDGEPLDVDAVLATPVDDIEPPPQERVESVSLEQFKAFADRLVRKSNDQKAALGRALRHVCHGEEFAKPSNRDRTIFELIDVIVRRFPDVDPVSVCELFKPSIELMTEIDESCPQLDVVEYKLGRAQEQIRKERLEQAQEEARAKKHRISQAFGGARDTPYTEEELEQFDDPEWIVQRGKSFYFFVGGSYVGPFTDDAQNAALTFLSPVPENVVSLFTVTDTGFKRKSMNDLAAEYGVVATEVRMDLRAQKSTFDKKTLVLTEAPCPLRSIEPKYHEDVAQWLELFAGSSKHEMLKTWIAAVTDLDHPCVALFLIGPKGVGKSLFAEGLARLWTTDGPSDLEEVFSNFNDSLASCPLCFADEQLPKDFKGYARNGELRSHVQARSRPFKRKFLPSAKLIGATRTIVAANNADILRTQESLTSNDIGAIADRYFDIQVQPEAAAFLEKCDTSDWVEGDKIAEHAIWLRDNHQWEPDGRFLIKVKDKRMTRDLATGGGPPSTLSQWLVNFLKYPENFETDPKGKGHVRVHEGRLLVNVQGVLNCWEKYVSNDQCPSTGRLATAIATLSHPERTKLVDELGVSTNYRIIDIENLIAWAERTGWASREEIETGLERETVLKTVEMAKERIARKMN